MKPKPNYRGFECALETLEDGTTKWKAYSRKPGKVLSGIVEGGDAEADLASKKTIDDYLDGKNLS